MYKSKLTLIFLKSDHQLLLLYQISKLDFEVFTDSFVLFFFSLVSVVSILDRVMKFVGSLVMLSSRLPIVALPAQDHQPPILWPLQAPCPNSPKLGQELKKLLLHLLHSNKSNKELSKTHSDGMIADQTWLSDDPQQNHRSQIPQLHYLCYHSAQPQVSCIKDVLSPKESPFQCTSCLMILMEEKNSFTT